MTASVAILMVLAGGVAAAGSLAVTGGKCEQQVCPLGIDVPRPVLGWTLESPRRGDRQTAYQILAASDPALLAGGKPDLWDSGKVVSNASLGVSYDGKPLVSGMRVWWQVRAWDGDGEPGAYGAPQWWEMALLLPADWHGKWISDGKALPQRDEDFYAPAPAPLMRKGFKVTGPVKRARIYISGLGYHELRLNGGRVGDHLLDPAWTCYDKRVLYATHDVTSLLRTGDNALGVMLGNGWFNPLPLRLWGHVNLRERLATGRPRVIVQLNIDYADGSSASVVTDESWRVADGPILKNNIYLGETYDARKEVADWDAPGFDDQTWRAAAIEAGALGAMRVQSQPPIRVTEELPALKVAEPKPGVFVYDFGQNFTGLVRFRFEAPAGTTVAMRYGELLNKDGSLNPLTSVCGQIKSRRKEGADKGQSVGGPGAPDVAWQGDTYITKGGAAETYCPRFTFHAFRYVEITGLSAAPPPAALTGLRLHSDVADAGSFACSNERFNRIQQMCRRTFVSNIIGVQSDCPHRERFGYGGDIVATSEALMLNFDMAGFYQKTARDWADCAKPDGMLTDTAPSTGIDYCGVGWGMAHPLLVSQLYRYHGDRRLLEEQYDTAKRWLLLVAGKYPDGIVKDGLGDHESLVPAPSPPLVTPLFFQSATMLATMARTLGHSDDATRFSALAEQIRLAYQEKLLDPKTGVAGSGSQACQAVALYTGMVPEAVRPLALERLVETIRDKHKGHLSTGILGTKVLLDVLADNGQAAVAYDIANQPDFPGWGWMLENGATTLWEHWAGSDNTFSNNHPMFGSVSQWFFNHLGGIRPADDAVGFDKILIAPQAPGDLQWVKASYQSARGPVTCAWKKTDGVMEIRVAVPVGATATVFVPAKEAAGVTEGGKPAAQAEGVKFLRLERGAAVFAVGSGSYVFGSLLHAEEQPFLYPQSDTFQQQLAKTKARGLTLTDYHIHIRGGMTREKAVLRQQHSGITSAVLENFGREWPLADNAKLKDFIDAHALAGPNNKRVPVGIQVNDRDWFTRIDPALRRRLDFVLADTMIMGLTAEGKPRRLWLPDVTIDDPEAWMVEYMAHNLRILGEPVSILANPTYLPPCIARLYDQLWTEERMRQVIAKAVANGIALEIQAGSDFPKPSFLKLAKTMGAKFSFGSNNFDDKTKDLARWFDAIELLDLRPADLWAAPAAHDFAK